MPRTFAAILDDCLEALKAGVSLDDCLDRYPAQAEQLRTHLLLVQHLGAIPRNIPRQGVQETTWNEFRNRAEDRRLGRKPAFSLNMSLGWLKPAAVAAALFVAVLMMGGGAVYASQDALPDSPLYPVKLASEDVRVWFTFDETSKAELLLDQSNERTDEIMELLRDGKSVGPNVLNAMQERNARAVRILGDRPEEAALLARAREQAAEQEQLLLVIWSDISDNAQDDYARVVATIHNAQLRIDGTPGSIHPSDLEAGVIHIAGAAQPGEDGVWVLGGVEVRLVNFTLGGANVEAGQPVKVVAARSADGELVALNVSSTGSLDADEQYVVSGRVEDVGRDTVVIGGQRITITEQTLVKLNLLRGKNVEVSVSDVNGEAVASLVEGPENISPSALAYEGVIQDEIPTGSLNNDWIVGGQRFVVTPSTQIDARAGNLAEGARARVEAVPQNGSLIAKRFVVLTGEAEAETIHVEGKLEQVKGASWVVSGLDVEAPSSVSAPEVGTLVALDGTRTGDVFVADRVITTFDTEAESPVLLRGDIRSIDANGAWKVGLATINVSDDTVVVGKPQQGTRVFVWAIRDSEGQLHAAYANVVDAVPFVTLPTP